MYTLYIGSNNKTGKLEEEKAISILNEYFNGYTYSVVNGVWKGTAEFTLIVDIATEKEYMINFLVVSLKKALKQKSIMVVKHNAEVKFM